MCPPQALRLWGTATGPFATFKSMCFVVKSLRGTGWGSLWSGGGYFPVVDKRCGRFFPVFVRGLCLSHSAFSHLYTTASPWGNLCRSAQTGGAQAGIYMQAVRAWGGQAGGRPGRPPSSELCVVRSPFRPSRWPPTGGLVVAPRSQVESGFDDEHLEQEEGANRKRSIIDVATAGESSAANRCFSLLGAVGGVAGLEVVARSGNRPRPWVRQRGRI